MSGRNPFLYFLNLRLRHKYSIYLTYTHHRVYCIYLSFVISMTTALFRTRREQRRILNLYSVPHGFLPLKFIFDFSDQIWYNDFDNRSG